MTRITFERSGGFAGIRLTANFDLEQLEKDEAATLQKLLDDADFFHQPKINPSNPRPDEFQYNISVVTETMQNSVQVSENSAPSNLRPLLDHLSRLARNPPK